MEKATEVIDFGYKPRPQQAAIHASGKRFAVLVTHRRMGKTIYAIMEMVDQGLRLDRHNPRYGYIAPTYAQAKRIAWDYLVDYCKKMPGLQVNTKDLTLTIPRPWKGDNIKIMLLGSENPDSLRGIYLDGCVLDEYGSMSNIILPEIVRPALSDRKGWLRVIGTPRGPNHFERIYDMAVAEQKAGSDRWAAFSFKASETGILSQEELDDAAKTMSREQYAQEFECDFSSAQIGSYFGDCVADLQARGHIGEVPWERYMPVETWWDLGMNDLTAIWFYQRVGDEHRFIDYYENCGKALDFYVKVMRDKPYIYGDGNPHHLPFDANVREQATGNTRIKTLRTLGLKATVPIKRAGFEDGIDAARRLLSANTWFDATKCRSGLDALKNYKKRWNPKLEIWEKGPDKGWANRAADALRYAALDIRLEKTEFEWLSWNRRKFPRNTVSEFEMEVI